MVSKLMKLRQLNMWTILSAVFAALIVIPSLNIFIHLFNKPNDNWEHIKTYLLKDYIFNTFTMAIFVVIFVVILGVSLAWIMTIYDFPLKKYLKWGLMLPLTIPPYIGAYVYYGMLNYTGVIQSFLRNNFGIKVNQAYFDVMNMRGAIFIFAIFLFPYVYAITRSFFGRQASSLIENARVLGSGELRTFFKIAVPVARTAIVGGAILVVLEVFNDFGVVSYYGVSTFSTAIFKTWFALGDIDSAVRLASILMGSVLVVLLIERFSRNRKRYHLNTTKVRPLTPIVLKGKKKVAILSYVWIVFALSFLLPTLQLIHWSVLSYERFLRPDLLKQLVSSVSVSLIASIIIIIVALIVANNTRIYNNLFSKVLSKATILGYSIPGAVIAIGVIITFVGLDRSLSGIYANVFNFNKTLVLSTSMVMLIFAYVIRFLAIGYNNIESGFEKVGKKYFEASLLLGQSKLKTFFRVDLPMMKTAVISGMILVFIDTMKELPLTLILRVFNFNTLATKAYEYASDEMIHEAAVPSILIIITSLIFIVVLNKVTAQKE